MIFMSCPCRNIPTRPVEVPKKRLLKRRLLQAPQAPFKAPIHSKCCIGGFRDTGLTLVIVLRCDWPLCDLRFKSYEHFKIKMFLSVPAGPWWIFQPKSSEQSTENAPVDISPTALSQTLCTAQYFWIWISILPSSLPSQLQDCYFNCELGENPDHLWTNLWSNGTLTEEPAIATKSLVKIYKFQFFIKIVKNKNQNRIISEMETIPSINLK